MTDSPESNDPAPAADSVPDDARSGGLISMPLVLYAVALTAAWAIGPRGPVYWDSFNYVAQATHGHVGGLALGRPLFVLMSFGVAKLLLALGGSVWSLEPLLRATWLAVSASAAPTTWVLARQCGAGPRGAAIAGAIMAVSPALAHTSAAVMTDGPSLALTLVAFVFAARVATDRDASRARVARDALCAGAALGAAFGLREQAIVQALSLVLVFAAAPRGRRLAPAIAASLAFAIVALAPVAYVFATQRDYAHSITAWLAAMRRERSDHPYRLRDLVTYGAWLVALGPAALVAAAAAWVQLSDRLIERRTVLMAVALPALAQLLLLGGYQDIAYSPRYLLPALPGAIAIPAALLLESWIVSSRARAIALGVALVAPVLVAAPVVRARERPLREVVDRLPRELLNVPPNAAIVSGQACPAIEMVRRLARVQPAHWRAPRPAWQTVCPGWGWPADVGERLDRARAEGREVIVDLRAGAWLGPRQHTARDAVEHWLRARRTTSDTQGITVWR